MLPLDVLAHQTDDVARRQQNPRVVRCRKSGDLDRLKSDRVAELVEPAHQPGLPGTAGALRK
ncbi:hypothetical protein SGFS_104510 [Streptomyces graminofaciens]|uniref:Uncharacterized protein n=1 Tax=Streptomyces graminofaciens TaxID=68212 RepID=A0ABN5W143_9ACTN|nr:hypothetical protein SGFS_104510 [Streptomyces graminofaciens]